MWKISRNLFFYRWPKKQQELVNNNNSLTLSTTVSTFPSVRKKSRSSGHSHKNDDYHKYSQRFWNRETMRFLLFKTSIIEKAGWLGTVTILCFDFHLKHLQFMRNYERGKSHCLLSRNVLAMPWDTQKPKEVFPGQEIKNESSLPACVKTCPAVPSEISSLDNLQKINDQYAAAVHNSSGLSHLEINSKKAFRNFQEAARLGSAQAFYNLGLCYELGKGTKINLTRAAFCYRKAAMKGHGSASFNLAVYFLKGIGGLPVDPEVAKLLISQAAEKDVPEAQLYIGLDNLEQEKYAEAFQIFSRLAQNNILDGKYYQGLCYENGWGIKKDERMATEIFAQAAKLGHSKSILKLSHIFEEGIGGCEIDLDFSTALCQMLTDQGDEELKNTMLRLKIKRMASMFAKKLFSTSPSPLNERKVIQNSVSVPELTSYQNEKHKKGLEALAAISYLDLITPLLPIETDMIDSRKIKFYIEEEKSRSDFASHYQINIPQLMAAKS